MTLAAVTMLLQNPLVLHMQHGQVYINGHITANDVSLPCAQDIIVNERVVLVLPLLIIQ